MTQYKITFKEIFFLAIPIIFSNLIIASSSLISMFLLAKINSDALAAGAIITSTYGLLIMMVVSILYSVSILIGHSKGGGRDQEIGSIVSSGITLAFIISIPLMVIYLYITPILQFLHQPIKVSQMTGDYFQGLVYGLIPSLIGAVFTQFFLGLAKTKVTLYFTIIGAIINSTISYFLIFGFGSIRPLGFFGAGLASSITAFFLLAFVLIYISSNPEFHKYKIGAKSFFKLGYCRALFKIGFPISIQYSTELLAFSTITYLMGTISTDALAAQQITLQCTMLSIMVIMGISQAGSILISHNMGKDSKLNKSIICKTTIMFGALFMQMVGLAYWLFSEQLISFYLDINNPSLHEIVLIAKELLIIAAFTQFFDSMRNISGGLLRGYGDTKTSMWTGLVSCWVIGLPLAIIFAFPLHFGAAGLRFGIMMGILYGCIQLISRLIKANQRQGFEVAYKTTVDAL